MIVEQIWTGNAYRNFNYLIACPETGEATAIELLPGRDPDEHQDEGIELAHDRGPEPDPRRPSQDAVPPQVQVTVAQRLCMDQQRFQRDHPPPVARRVEPRPDHQAPVEHRGNRRRARETHDPVAPPDLRPRPAKARSGCQEGGGGQYE